MNEEYEDDDWDSTPPTLPEVCSRIFSLAATLWRAQLEMHLQRDATQQEVVQTRFDELNAWIQREQLTDKLSDAEKDLHALPLGAWNDSQVFETMWRFEALVPLLWATGHFEAIPSWLEMVDGQTIMQKAQLLGSGESFLSSSSLRNETQIEKMYDAAEFWHWRCRTEMLRRGGTPAPPGDSYEGTIGRALEVAVADGIVADTVDGDVSVRGVAYANLTQEEWANIASISIERHYAMSWLAGYAPGNDWDDTPTDT
jgi:hypothetical protein